MPWVGAQRQGEDLLLEISGQSVVGFKYVLDTTYYSMSTSRQKLYRGWGEVNVGDSPLGRPSRHLKCPKGTDLGKCPWGESVYPEDNAGALATPQRRF